MKFLVAALTLTLLSAPAVAQHQHPQTPYGGLQQRDIKALSEQQLADLKLGRGMGLALAAELNGYPGPLHVLELADQLNLNGEQRQRVQQLFDAMKVEATAVGERLIAQETELDRAFATGSISPATLNTLAARIGQTQGELRTVHLKYHLTVAELLTADQKHRYAQLRGYRH